MRFLQSGLIFSLIWSINWYLGRVASKFYCKAHGPVWDGYSHIRSRVRRAFSHPVKCETGVLTSGPVWDGRFHFRRVATVASILSIYTSYNTPCKHVCISQYRASTGPMLAASDQYWPGTGPLWHVYGEVTNVITRVTTTWKTGR